ncbi:MAG: helix-turn-helix domain-containing protein [Lachnospiraceae bacterium]|nr:helix-turn-helix domain-containing protein [Lachnospiraceae bacterium]
MKLKYDRLEVGDRIKQKRTLLGLTQEEVSVHVGLSSKYYADIERGSCGMSVESLISIGEVLDMSLDYIIYGKLSGEDETLKQSDEIRAILSILNNASENKRKYIMRLLQLQIAVWNPKADTEE